MATSENITIYPWPRLVATSITLLTLVVCACAPTKPSAADILEPEDRVLALELPGTDERGNPVSLQDYRNKVLLVAFWAPWCPPCREEVPRLIDIKNRYARSGLDVLGVTVQDGSGWVSVKSFAMTSKINYRLVLLAPSRAAGHWGIGALPTIMILDRRGRIAATLVGLTPKDVIEKAVRTLISQD